jgi:hypothetical protein
MLKISARVIGKFGCPFAYELSGAAGLPLRRRRDRVRQTSLDEPAAIASYSPRRSLRPRYSQHFTQGAQAGLGRNFIEWRLGQPSNTTAKAAALTARACSTGAERVALASAGRAQDYAMSN